MCPNIPTRKLFHLGKGTDTPKYAFPDKSRLHFTLISPAPSYQRNPHNNTGQYSGDPFPFVVRRWAKSFSNGYGDANLYCVWRALYLDHLPHGVSPDPDLDAILVDGGISNDGNPWARQKHRCRVSRRDVDPVGKYRIAFDFGPFCDCHPLVVGHPAQVVVHPAG